jgi:hypothetical protein
LVALIATILSGIAPVSIFLTKTSSPATISPLADILLPETVPEAFTVLPEIVLVTKTLPVTKTLDLLSITFEA